MKLFDLQISLINIDQEVLELDVSFFLNYLSQLIVKLLEELLF